MKAEIRTYASPENDNSRKRFGTRRYLIGEPFFQRQNKDISQRAEPDDEQTGNACTDTKTRCSLPPCPQEKDAQTGHADQDVGGQQKST